MKFAPHDYQKYCIEYIKNHDISALFLDMGLGKTAVTLTALRDLMFDEMVVAKVLVIVAFRGAKMGSSQGNRDFHYHRHSQATHSSGERKCLHIHREPRKCQMAC